VEKKVRAGKTHVILKPEAAPKRLSARSDVVDLMPLLKRSLQERATSKPAREGRRPAARKSAVRKTAARKSARAKAPARTKRTA